MNKPAVDPSKNVGQILHDLGMVTTTWLDQITHQEQHGSFDPLQNDPAKRYGSPGLAVFGWPARNYTGGHAVAGIVIDGRVLMNAWAVELAPQVLGCPPSGNDTADLDFIEGATAYVLHQAAALGVYSVNEAQPGAVSGAPVTSPAPATPADFLANLPVILGQIQAGLAVVGQMQQLVQQIHGTLSSSPPAPPPPVLPGPGGPAGDPRVADALKILNAGLDDPHVGRKDSGGVPIRTARTAMLAAAAALASKPAAS